MPVRAHLEASAARGNRESAALLEGPPCPDALAYLLDWAVELHGRSGIGPDGFVPLTYTTLADWAALTGARPTPLDVRALFALDAVMRHPDALAPAPEPEAPLTPPAAAPWPTRKADDRNG